jgi:hypothetical protein
VYNIYIENFKITNSFVDIKKCITLKKQKMTLDKDFEYTQADLDNHSNQLNPNNDEYDHCREGN